MNKTALRLNNSLLSNVVLIAVMLWLVIPSEPAAEGNVYYVDFDNGDNSNNGLTPGTAWKECPGTQNPTDTPADGWTPIASGDTVQFTGGQTWIRPILISSDYFAQPTQESERIILTTREEDISNRAIIDLTGYTTEDYIIRLARDYISIRYFELRDLSNSGVPQGIYGYEVSYFNISYNKIHDILDSSGANSYGIELDRGGSGTIAFNEVGNVEEKAIELYRCDNTAIHHNLLYTETAFGHDTDHGMVISGKDNLIYNNIIYAQYGVTFRANPSYGFKVDGNSSSASFANSNKVYNNLIYGWPCGLAAIDTHDNLFVHNTFYAGDVSVNSDSYDNNGLRIYNANNNTFKNNIVYYVALTHNNHSHQTFFCSPGPTCMNNTVTNNLFYRTGSDERFRVGGTVSILLATMEGSATWNGENGNVMSNNSISAVPGFSGGSHPVLNLPAGFNSDWSSPDNTGLELTAGSYAKDNGEALASPYNVDLRGIPRPQGSGWDIGAYEYISATSTGDPNGDGNPEQIQNYLISQNYPNPFNPATTIKYSLPAGEAGIPVSSRKYEVGSIKNQENESPLPRRGFRPARQSSNFLSAGGGGLLSVKLIVYDLLGKEVATLVNEQQRPGIYEVTWDASNMSSGVYFYQLKAGSFIQVKKLVLMK